MGRSRAPEVEILIQGEPETLEVSDMSGGGSYYFGGHNSDYDDRGCLDVDSVDDCAVVNECVEESQEAEVDTIVIGQQEEEDDEEEADYEDDIKIQEESLED